MARSTAFTTPVSISAARHGTVLKSSYKPVRLSAKPTRKPRTITSTASPPNESDKAQNSRYWQGEWICVDCGFTYKPTRKVKFEDLPASWKCPQCNAPKRRFAKKAGDLIAETSGTSNLPILLFSAFGLLATIAFGIWASQNL
ncbi:Rubredoxin-1 [Gracilariopsis chorda]|uniref:Rubredoxin-1 n=1 Tax=Gracilariopsis chorda TaxID=448386 RepID=A0A2V3IR95_9FLOR|nr:Rubredoxin-1 [Gracilariopsis chorda]|eukprot:PXF44642.1 Rubredoxin-1 [Gracilariopsis chorda]